MPETPDIFIETSKSAVIPTRDGNQFDPIAGYSAAARDYVNQNPVVLEREVTKEKDYSINVFSTTTDLLYTQYQNNMITSITRNPGMDHTVLSSQLDVGNGKGVYIIERYMLSGIMKRDLLEFLEYYADTKGLSYRSETIDVIKAMISNAVNIKKKLSKTEIRVLTFIPINKIKDNQYTYVNGPGVVIVHGDVPHNLLHPYSPAYLEDSIVNPVREDVGVCIDITVIDKDNKPYYYMVGNKARVIRPSNNTKASSVLPMGGTVSIKRGNTIIDEIYIPLEKFEANGFYRSKELCVTNGDRSLVVEEAKHKLELKKIKASFDKLVLEQEGRERLHTMELDKKTLEFKYYKATKEIELKSTYIKHKFDNVSRLMDINTSRFKLAVDITKMTAEVHRARELHQLKTIDNVVKLIEVGIKFFK